MGATIDLRAARLARSFLQLLSSAASVLLGSGISVLLGFNALPTSSPVLAFAQRYRVASIVAVVLLAVLTVGSLIVSRQVAWDTRVGMKLGTHIARFLGSTAISTVGSTAFCILIGFNSFPSSVPFLPFIRAHPPLALGIVGVVLALIIFSPLLSLLDEPAPNNPGSGWRGSWLGFSTAISAVSTTLLVALLATVLIRPSWCPSAICPAPIRVIRYHPYGMHDANMEAYFLASQTFAYVLSGNPGQDTPPTVGASALPSMFTSAIRIDDPNFIPYRAVVGVHSEQSGTPYGILIDQVAIVVLSTNSAPTPLNVWEQLPLNYHTEPYLVEYHGEPAGAHLPVTFQPLPASHVQLEPGGSDELDIQVTSRVTGEMRFQVQVTYRVTNEDHDHTLTVPVIFDVVFATGANWHVYQLGPNGHLVPAP